MGTRPIGPYPMGPHLMGQVAAINARHVEALRECGTDVRRVDAIDRTPNGHVLGSTALRERVNAKATGQPGCLEVYIGMEAVLSRNENVQGDFANGVFGVVESFSADLSAIYVRPHGSPKERPPLRVTRRTSVYTVAGLVRVSRTQFPLLPAHALTVRSHLRPVCRGSCEESYEGGHKGSH